MRVIENILFLAVILCQDNLLGTEESPILVIKVHFLLIANTALGDPELLRRGLHPESQQANSTDKGESNGGNDDNTSVAVVDGTNFFKYCLQLHSVNQLGF